MKQITKLILLSVISLFATAYSCYSQDIITLKNGDEIKSKILEVTSDQIKYKKWDNLDGPSYSTPKSDVFMIKYKNGTKDVFNTIPTNSNPSLSNNSNIGNKFIGTWYHKKYDGNNNKSKITISKAGEDYLVNCEIMEREGGV